MTPITDAEPPKKHTTAKLINFISFQIGWQACTWSAVYGYHAACVPVVLIIAAIALAISPQKKAEAIFFVIAAIIGIVIDRIMLLTGVFSFTAGPMNSPSEVIIVSLWSAAFFVNFATTIPNSLAWLAPHPWWSVILGATGGPLAYWTGERMGAIALAENPWLSLAALALVWGILTPMLFVTWKEIKLRAES